MEEQKQSTKKETLEYVNIHLKVIEGLREIELNSSEDIKKTVDNLLIKKEGEKKWAVNTKDS